MTNTTNESDLIAKLKEAELIAYALLRQRSDSERERSKDNAPVADDVEALKAERTPTEKLYRESVQSIYEERVKDLEAELAKVKEDMAFWKHNAMASPCKCTDFEKAAGHLKGVCEYGNALRELATAKATVDAQTDLRQYYEAECNHSKDQLIEAKARIEELKKEAR